MNTKKIAAFAVFLFFAATPAAHGASGPSISALDTVAGFETVIKGAGFMPGQNIAASIIKPDGGLYNFNLIADNTGAVNEIVNDSVARVSGIYTVSALSASAEFEVFPGEMSAEKSGLYADKTSAAASGMDAIHLTARITDDFGNPLPYHDVSIISSRNADKISPKSAQTDMSGLVIFSAVSAAQGVSIFSVTDETSASKIAETVKITFVKSAPPVRPSIDRSAKLRLGAASLTLGAIGGDTDVILLAQAGAQASRFEIENLAATVQINTSVSFRVRAADNAGAAIANYSGTIIFSSSDTNATFPVPYTFQTADNGQKTFDLGLKFGTTGAQTLTVQEQGNALIQGEKTVTVVEQTTGGTGTVRITRPAAGTYSVNALEIAGDANPNAQVKIFDNGTHKSTVTANSSGRFSYTTSLLADGTHTFIAESNGVSGAPVTVTIDSTPAAIENVIFDSTVLAPGEGTALCLRSDPDLSAVQATIEDVITDLEPDNANLGTYCGTIRAPQAEGQYAVNAILTDRLGNVSPIQEIGRITVSREAVTGSGATFSVPSKVQGLTATPGNGRITLAWQAAEAEAGIAFYRIYYGATLPDLNLVANTLDASTAWYIPNLQNGTTYYFQVVGVDANNNEGDNRSNVVSAAPSASIDNADLAICTPVPCSTAGAAPQMPEDGPEIYGMIIASLIGAGIYKKIRR